MSRKICCCVAVYIVLSSVYAARRSLNCINNLTDCKIFEDTNILELLHWFANEVHINDDIQLTFDANSEYGSHRYENIENLLDPLPSGYQYYTIGNLYENETEPLPSYVRNPPRRINHYNSARIIFRVNEWGPQHGQIIDQVYITQHYDPSENCGSGYNPADTYKITIHFLRQLRKKTIIQIQQCAGGFPPRPYRNASDQFPEEPYGNASVHFPEENNSEPDIYINMPHTPTIQDGCSGNCMGCVCVFVGIFILILILILLIYLLGGFGRK